MLSEVLVEARSELENRLKLLSIEVKLNFNCLELLQALKTVDEGRISGDKLH